MRYNHDTLSSSDDSAEETERRTLPARAVHAVPAMAHVRLEQHTAVPMLPERIRTMPIPIQTMFDRSAEHPAASTLHGAEEKKPDDDEEEEEESSPRSTPAPTKPVASPSEASRAEQPIVWPSDEAQPTATAEGAEVGTEADAADQTTQATHRSQAAVTRPTPLASPSQSSISERQPVLQPITEHLQTPLPTTESQSDNATEQYEWPPEQPSTTVAAPPRYNQAPSAPAPPVVAARQNAMPNAPAASIGSPKSAMPPVPPINRPPVPPTPAYGSPYNQPPVSQYNLAPPTPTGNSYNQAPSPNPAGYNTLPQVPMQYVRGVDALARLGVVGNFLGNRKTRRTLNQKIETNKQTSEANYAGLKASQAQQHTEQQRQAWRSSVMETAERKITPAHSEQAPLTATGARNETMPLPPIITPNPNIQQRPPVTAATERLQQAPAEQVTLDQEPVKLQAKEHYQESSWHRFAVDNKGNVIRDAVNYGKAFKDESVKEAISDKVGMGVGLTAAGSSAASTQGQGPIVGQNPATGQGSLPSGMTTPTLPPGMPTRVDPQHQLPTKTKRSDIVPGPVFWVMLVVIFAAFFAAASF